MNFYSKKFHGIKQVNAYCLTLKDAKNTSAQVISLSVPLISPFAFHFLLAKICLLWWALCGFFSVYSFVFNVFYFERTIILHDALVSFILPSCCAPWNELPGGTRTLKESRPSSVTVEPAKNKE